MPLSADDLAGRLVVAYDGRCAACSGLAQHITVYGIEGVVVAERDSAALRAHLDRHGLTAPGDRPFVVTAGSQRTPQVCTGMRMRAEMARTLGVRHFAAAVRLLAAEAKARRAR